MAKETTSVSIDEEYKKIISASSEVNFSGIVNEVAESVAESLAEGEGVEVDVADDLLLETARANREEAREELEEALETFNHWDSLVQDALEEKQKVREKRDERVEEFTSLFSKANNSSPTPDNPGVKNWAGKCDLTPKQLLKKANIDYGLTLPTHIDFEDVELPDDNEVEPVAEVNPADDVVHQAREAVNAD